MMLKTKFVTMTLAGLLTIGTIGVTASAEESTPKGEPGKPNITINFNREEKAEELAEKQATVEAKADEFAAKGASFEAAQAGLENKMLENGRTEEEISSLLDKFASKFDELKAEKGEEVALKQAEREANVSSWEEKGIVKKGI